MLRTKTIALLATLMMSTASLAQQSVVIMGGIQDGHNLAASQNDAMETPRKPVSLKVEEVTLNRLLEPGAILINTKLRKLFLSLEDGKALSFPVGVGREGFSWSGEDRISKKTEWPDWRPPKTMLQREAARGRFLPEFVKGGPSNPLGARALYIGSTEYRIHGTSAPWSIGRASSSGCIRMLNEHVIQLYQLAQIGARVIVE